MNIKDIVTRASGILGLEDLDFSNPTEDLVKVIDSAKMIVSELTFERLPLKTKEKAVLSQGKGSYEQLNFPVREILKVSVGGKNYTPTMYPNYFSITTEISGEVEVTYLYYLNDVPLEETLNLPPQIPPYVLASGVVSEYYYRTGRIDEALFYKTRYDYSISSLTRSLKSAYVPRRGFIW